MDEVKRLRNEIDDIDEEMVRLLKARHEHARRMGRVKNSRGLALRDPKREEQILRNVQRIALKMGLAREPVRRIFVQVFSMAIQAQKSRPREGQELAGLEVLVAGGTGSMGRLFANLASNHGASVKIFGRTPSGSRRVAMELGVRPGNFSDARNSDIVLVAVPIEATLNVSLKLGSMMKPESMLADLSSVKTGIADNIARGTRRFEYVSLHPLFGPDLSHIDGQHIAAIPYRTGPTWKKLLMLFAEEGANVHLTAAQSHDRTMARIQGIHHFGLICLGMALGGGNRGYPTRSLEITERQIQRLVDNWETVMAIQELNPFSAKGRLAFKRTVVKMVGMSPAASEESLRVLTDHVQKWSRKR